MKRPDDIEDGLAGEVPKDVQPKGLQVMMYRPGEEPGPGETRQHRTIPRPPRTSSQEEVAGIQQEIRSAAIGDEKPGCLGQILKLFR